MAMKEFLIALGVGLFIVALSVIGEATLGYAGFKSGDCVMVSGVSDTSVERGEFLFFRDSAYWVEVDGDVLSFGKYLYSVVECGQ